MKIKIILFLVLITNMFVIQTAFANNKKYIEKKQSIWNYNYHQSYHTHPSLQGMKLSLYPTNIYSDLQLSIKSYHTYSSLQGMKQSLYQMSSSAGFPNIITTEVSNPKKTSESDTIPAKYKDWDCVFNENFDGNILDLNKWQIRHDKGRWEEWFSKDNIKISDGNLIITGKEENSPFGDKKYSAGEISTGKSFKIFSGNIRYGYFEARIKVPRGVGFFPAFWLSQRNGKNSSWPPELDIVEYSGFGNKMAHGTVWYKDSTGKALDKKIYKEYPLGFWNKFHIYSMEWNQNEIIFYLDNIEVGRTNENVPHDFLRIVLSLQLNHIPEKGINFTRLNKKMYIDYVRVYVPKNYKTVKGFKKCGVFFDELSFDSDY